MDDKELVGLYELDIKLLKSEGFITDSMTNDEKYKMIRLNQQYLMCEDKVEGMTKNEYMLQNPDNFDYGMLAKSVYFVHSGKLGQGYVMAISRWFDRAYRIHSHFFNKPVSVNHKDIFLTMEELFEELNSKYRIEEK